MFLKVLKILISISLTYKIRSTLGLNQPFALSYKVLKDSNVENTFNVANNFFELSNIDGKFGKFKCLSLCNQDESCLSVVLRTITVGLYGCTFYKTKPNLNNQILSDSSSILYIKIVEEVISALPDLDQQYGIKSDLVTDSGEWNPLVNCPEGTSAIGYIVKVDLQPNSIWDFYDNTGLNAIKLICNDTLRTEIQSGEGHAGTWSIQYTCPSGQSLIGFKFKVLSYQFFSDNSAANGIYMYCQGGSLLQSDQASQGTWGSDKNCSDNEVICGIQSQIRSQSFFLDNTSLNNVYFKCCSI